MTAHADREVAASLDAPEALLPVLPELFDGIEELGCWPERIVGLLAPLELPPSTRVLDLACGKGPVSRALAREFAFDCLGVDLFAPFVDAARALATAEGLAARCTFEHGDLRAALRPAAPYDVVVYTSIDALGAPGDCVAALRSAVRPGGWMVIDALHLGDAEALDEPGYEHYASRAATARALESHGDRLRAVDEPPREAWARAERELAGRVAERARRSAVRHARLSGKLERYARIQSAEAETLSTHGHPALWLVQRSPDHAHTPAR